MAEGRGWYASLMTLGRAAGLWRVSEPSADEAASTLFRFFRSKHVGDLRLIVNLAVLLFLVLLSVLMCGLAVRFVTRLNGTHSLGIAFHSLGLASLIPQIGSTVAVVGAVIAWAYRSASTRLGVVDLFACEIGTLCRVSAIYDVGKRFVELLGPSAGTQAETHAPPPELGRFVSQEEYFPVFNGNVRDLQVLEANVVSHITEFYTYTKAMRDSLRKLYAMAPPAPPANQAMTRADAAPLASQEPLSSATDIASPWREAMSNVIYMLFLAHESARNAVEDLVEFEPANAERKMVILLTELKCYAFLITEFGESDLRHMRLKLREAEYKEEVPDLYALVETHSDEETDWLPARRTLRDLAIRYEEALGESMTQARARREREQAVEQAAARIPPRRRKLKLQRI